MRQELAAFFVMWCMIVAIQKGPFNPAFIFNVHSILHKMTRTAVEWPDYEISQSETDTTCRPVYVVAVQAGCTRVSGLIYVSIQGERAIETSMQQGSRTGYAKYSLHRLITQLLLTMALRLGIWFTKREWMIFWEMLKGMDFSNERGQDLLLLLLELVWWTT